jgi:acetolactate synthase small subunit
MAVMTQEQMKKLVQGGSIVDDSSMEILNRHLMGIAIASLGDDKEELSTVLKAYADELADLVGYAEFFDLQHRWNAMDHIEWLRAR